MPIIPVTSDTVVAWAKLCSALWPDHSIEEMVAEFRSGACGNEFLYEMNSEFIAFISLSLRHDYVEGKTDSNPVGYLEGIYVTPEYRRKGIAAELVAFAKQWCREWGCTMLASDCELENGESRMFHHRLGFEEISVNVHFKQNL
jgi:aminoglycoside 6'-N-acetyltransferase I